MKGAQLIRVTLMAFTLALGAGCATVGQDFATHKVDDIKIGETTRADIETMFGEPWRTGVEDGKPTWTYARYRWSAFSDAETTDLLVRFAQDGSVSSYVYNTTK